MIRKIAVNTGGGDAPGLNAAIRAITLAALRRGWEVFGIRNGYRGLLEGAGGIVRLDRAAVRGIGHLGGTILGATNRGDPFRVPVETADGVAVRDRSAEIVARFASEGFDALVALGGDGSLAIAARLLSTGLPRVLLVPKTIDNDLPGTEACIGFETAVATATDAIDRVHSTAQAHERVLVVEVMGRNAGFIALHAGIAGGADVVLIPEIPFDLARVCEKVRARERAGRPFSIIVVAEGAAARGGEPTVKAPADGVRPQPILGGIGELVATEVARRTGKEARTLVLGHLLRGGSPVTADRVLGTLCGVGAIQALAESSESGLIAVKGDHTELTPFANVAGQSRSVPLGSQLVQTARALGLSLGDEPPGSFDRPGAAEPSPP